LPGSCTITWVVSSAFCALAVFWDRVSLYSWASLLHDPPIYASLCSWNRRCTPTRPPNSSDGVPQTFCLSFWPLKQSSQSPHPD
jgi:hypothetical protein